MLVDPALWLAFRQAKDALVTALQGVLDTQLEPRALVASPSSRSHDATPYSENALRLAVSEAEKDLEAALSDLSHVRSILMQRCRAAENLLSPFAMLPHELTRNIIPLVIDDARDWRAGSPRHVMVVHRSQLEWLAVSTPGTVVPACSLSTANHLLELHYHCSSYFRGNTGTRHLVGVILAAMRCPASECRHPQRAHHRFSATIPCIFVPLAPHINPQKR